MDFSTFRWHNEPPSWRVTESGLEVTTGPGGDFWRTTHYGFIRDSGHFFYQEATGDLDLSVRFRGDYRDQFDQAGLMLRVDPSNWLKCGVEYVDGLQNVSAVVTREFSDWSVVPLRAGPAEVRLRVTRRAEAVEIHYALGDGDFSMLRLAYLPPSERVQVGVACCSPDGKGFPVVFRDLEIRPVESSTASHEG